MYCVYVYIVSVLYGVAILIQDNGFCLANSSKALVAMTIPPPPASCKQLGAFSFPWLLASSNLIAIDSRRSAYATRWAGHSPRNLEWSPIQMLWKHSSAAGTWHNCDCASSVTFLKSDVDSDNTSRCAVSYKVFICLIFTTRKRKSCHRIHPEWIALL